MRGRNSQDLSGKRWRFLGRASWAVSCLYMGFLFGTVVRGVPSVCECVTVSLMRLGLLCCEISHHVDGAGLLLVLSHQSMGVGLTIALAVLVALRAVSAMLPSPGPSSRSHGPALTLGSTPENKDKSSTQGAYQRNCTLNKLVLNKCYLDCISIQPFMGEKDMIMCLFLQCFKRKRQF